MTNLRRRDAVAAGTGLVLAEQAAASELLVATWSGLCRGLVDPLAAGSSTSRPAAAPAAHSDSC